MMADDGQADLLSPTKDLGFVRLLLADLHDDLVGKVQRFRQLADLAAAQRLTGTMMPGGEVVEAAWNEARSSFINGSYVATVMLCQGLAEHMLAAHLESGLEEEQLPPRVSFQETLSRCLARKVITHKDANDLRRLMGLRNPLSHYRNIDDPLNLSRRAVNTGLSAAFHLSQDAGFAISMAIRLLALPAFRLDNPTRLKPSRSR